MRHRKAFFSITVAPAAVLLAGTVAMGDGEKPPSASLAAALPSALSSCVAGGEGPTFTVSRGPTFVPCDDEGGGECTEIEYQVDGTGGAVYALAGKGVVSVSPRFEGTQVGDPCFGVDGFGEGACHEQAVRTFPGEDGKFRIKLEGLRSPSPSSVALGFEDEGGGVFFQACEILGLGLENTPNPEQVTLTTEKVSFKGCVVEFTRDAATGEVVQARLTADSPASCTSPFLGEGKIIAPQPVGDLEVKLKDGTSLGKGKFGEGYLSTGTDSCTTRVIGGRVYSWCS